PSYLAAMGIPLKQGRFFTEQDNERSEPVVVIDEVFARKHFPNADPIGKRVNYSENLAQIIGVVGHVKQWGLDSDDTASIRAQLYEPFRQLGDTALPRLSSVGMVARAEGAGPALWDSIRRVVQSQNRENVIFNPQTMSEVIADSLARRRFSMTLLNAFAVVALMMASVGLYGVISYLVG